MAFPPLTRQQLMDRCDLAGIARVVSVARQTANSCAVVKLVFLRVVKGTAKERWGFVHVRLQGGGAQSGESGMPSWTDKRDYPVGATVATFLDWNGPDEIYQTTWPGAVQPVAATATKAQVA